MLFVLRTRFHTTKEYLIRIKGSLKGSVEGKGLCGGGMVNLTGRGYFQKGHTLNVGKIWKEETNRRRSFSLMGHENFNKEGKGCFCRGSRPWNKGLTIDKAMYPDYGMRGKTHSLIARWKMSRIKNKGKSQEIELLRKTLEYREWRRKVFERDDFTCQECGKRGCRLHPHHIKEKSIFPELVFDVTNGITLCRDCHKQTESYGRNKKEVEEWPNSRRRMGSSS